MLQSLLPLTSLERHLAPNSSLALAKVTPIAPLTVVDSTVGSALGQLSHKNVMEVAVSEMLNPTTELLESSVARPQQPPQLLHLLTMVPAVLLQEVASLRVLNS